MIYIAYNLSTSRAYHISYYIYDKHNRDFIQGNYNKYRILRKISFMSICIQRRKVHVLFVVLRDKIIFFKDIVRTSFKKSFDMSTRDRLLSSMHLHRRSLPFHRILFLRSLRRILLFRRSLPFLRILPFHRSHPSFLFPCSCEEHRHPVRKH